MSSMNNLSKDALLVAPRQQLIDLIVSQQTTINDLQDALKKVDADFKSRMQELEFQIDWFRRQAFGTKSEKHVPDDEIQIALELGITPPVNPVTEKQHISYDRKKGSPNEPKAGHGRGKMPEHLPIIDKVIEPDVDTGSMKNIGFDISWYYDFVPGSLRVIRIKRMKYAPQDNSTVVMGALPELPIDKGNAGASLITQVVTDKYLYHIPLDRQRKKYKCEYDVNFSISWLCDLVKSCGFWIEPVHRGYTSNLITSPYICADETPIPVLCKDKKGKTHRGYFWVYYDPLQKIVAFDYRKSRSHHGPCEFLKDFHGILQIDGYEGYNDIIRSNGITRAACMDHVRRKFEQALSYDQERAQYALDTMRKWYAVEADAKENNLNAEDRLKKRIELTVPSMEEFCTWMGDNVKEVLPKSPIGKAISYALNQWKYFKPFMTDGRVEISNIATENKIRPVAIGRKNYMFKGSHEAAQRAAMIYSLVATAQCHDINPSVYLKDILEKLPQSKSSQIQDFLIPNWKIPQQEDTSN